MSPQTRAVYEYMQRNGSITSLQATLDLGVTRLSAKIYELKHKENIPIEFDRKNEKTRYGTHTSYKVYRLAESVS